MDGMTTRRDAQGNALPPRMHVSRGAYYHVAGNQWRPLGKGYAEALREWARIEGAGRHARTIAQAAEAFLLERGPELAPKTRAGYLGSLRRLLPAFGACALDGVARPDVKGYLKACTAPVAANRDKAFLSSVYSFAISEGWCDDNPCHGVARRAERPRRRTVAEGEVVALGTVMPLLWRALLATALLSGMRPGELRLLKRDQLTTKGIELVRAKTGAESLIQWSPDLRNAVEAALGAHRVPSVWVFPSRKGGPYEAAAFSRTFARLCKRAGIEGLRLHDARRTAATNADDLEHARALLGHGSSAITKRVYRIRDTVRPVGA